MKNKGIIIKIFIFAVFICLTLLPVILIYMLSQKEKLSYIQDTDYIYKEAAYGEARSVRRETVKQTYTVDAVITGSYYEYVSMEDGDASVKINVGEEVHKDDLIAVCGNQKLYSPCDGIIDDIDMYSERYIKILSFSKLQMTCFIDINILGNIKNSEKLENEYGDKMTIANISNISENNCVKVVFDIDNRNYMYGQQFNDMKLYTGREYANVLVIDKDCVYRKGNTCYVRTLEDAGEMFVFKEETEVEIGFETNEYYGVSNLYEGTLCDSGYKAFLAESGD